MVLLLEALSLSSEVFLRHLLDALEGRSQGTEAGSAVLRETIREVLQQELQEEPFAEIVREELFRARARNVHSGAAAVQLMSPGRNEQAADPLERLRDPLEAVRRRLGLSERQFREEVKTARQWLKRLLTKVPPESRLGTIRGAYKRYRGAVFGTLLLEEARRAIPADPAKSRSLAEAALVSCEATHPSEPDPQVRVPGLAIRGNAQRALGHLPQAEVDLLDAVRLLDRSDLDDLSVSAEIDFYIGSLRKDQGRFEEAGVHLTRAASLYPLIGDHQKAAATWLKLGLVQHAVHRFEDAIASANKALSLLDSHAEEWLVAYAHYNLAYFLHGKGDLDRAEAEIDAHEALIEKADDGLRFRTGWLRARIAFSRGERDRAELLFTETYRRAEKRKIPFDTGLVGLELALVHLVQGRTARVQKLALQALEIFAEQEVERETRAALELLDAAARRDAVSREIVERAIAALDPGCSISGR